MNLSIVIATHARPESLTRLIASLAPQLHAGDHEVLIAENGTPAPASLDRSAFATDVTIAHLHEPRPGKCRAQNRAIAVAHGDVIAFLDDDLAVADGYVYAIEQFFAIYSEFAAMKGRILPAEDPIAKVGAAAPYLDLPIADHGDRGGRSARRVGSQHGLPRRRLGPGRALR